MALKNYTGEMVGLTDKNGSPRTVLPSIGKAIVTPDEEDLLTVDDGIPVYMRRKGRVRYLPNTERADDLYIVTREVAEVAKGTRFDLVIAEEPYIVQGATFYKKLVRI